MIILFRLENYIYRFSKLIFTYLTLPLKLEIYQETYNLTKIKTTLYYSPSRTNKPIYKIKSDSSVIVLRDSLGKDHSRRKRSQK